MVYQRELIKRCSEMPLCSQEELNELRWVSTIHTHLIFEKSDFEVNI